MKRGFIRGLWGSMVENAGEAKIPRRLRTDDDIARIINCQFNSPFKTYVMGKDNYDELVSLGCDCTLISNEEYLFDRVKHQYRNKLEIIKYAMEQDGYDQIVYLDWDCVPVATLAHDFWKTLQAKNTFQACLQSYRRPRATWRRSGSRLIPNGGFIYIGDKKIPNEAIRLWHETGEQDNDEISYAKLTDNILGGWMGEEVYWDKFEPDFCNLHRCSAHNSDKINKKNVLFIHYQGGRNSSTRKISIEEGKTFSVDPNYKEEI